MEHELIPYKTMPTWTAETLPEPFRKMHNTKVGTWAHLTILEGALTFYELDEDGNVLAQHLFTKDSEIPFVEPQAWHRVSPASDDLKCYLTFYCTPEDYFAKKSHPQEKKHEFKREKIPLHPVKTTESIRMDVASPKLAIGIRGNKDIGNLDQYRYHLLLKLLFTMMFGWTSQRFQKLYETGKLDASLSLEIEVDPRFHFVILTMDTKEPVALSHQFRKAIRNFMKDEDVTEDHLDIVKTEMYGEFLHSMDSLEYIATQYHPTETGSTLFDLPKLLQEITLEDVLEAGHDLIDNSDMVDCTIFPI